MEKVFNDDYILMKILRLLNFKEQMVLSSLSGRMKHLIASIWKVDATDLQMNQKKCAGLTSFEFVMLCNKNRKNIRKLTLDRNDGKLWDACILPWYFQNLSELRIAAAITSDQLTIVIKSCISLNVLEFDQRRPENQAPVLEDGQFYPFSCLNKIKVLILRNLNKFLCRNSFRHLHDLEHLELYNVEMKNSDPLKRIAIMPQIKYLLIDTGKEGAYTRAALETYDFTTQCLNVIKLRLKLPKSFRYTFSIHHLLKTLRLQFVFSPSFLCEILKCTDLKYLEFDGIPHEDTEFEDWSGIISNLKTLKVHKEWAYFSHHGWSKIFMEPTNTFQHLQELKFSNSNVDDSLIGVILLKCPMLKRLHLIRTNITGIFLNEFKNLKTLILEYNSSAMSWSRMYAILRDLKQLEHLQLDKLALYNDSLCITVPMDVDGIDYVSPGDQLKVLKLADTDMNFWLHVLFVCKGFKNVHTLCIRDQTQSENIALFISQLKQISTLQIENCFQLDLTAKALTKVRHLTLDNCSLIKEDIFEILNYSQVEKAEIFRITFKSNQFPKHLEDMHIFMNLTSITLTYDILLKTLRLWQTFLEKAPKFQLICMEHESPTELLKHLLKYSTVAKQQIREIYTNIYEELNPTIQFCSNNLKSPGIVVSFLSKDNKRLWKSRYNDVPTMIIEKY